MSQFCKFADFNKKTQKSMYHFCLKQKNSLITHKGLLYGKNSFVGEVTCKTIAMGF